jgi:hypothetical protein
MTSCVTEKMFSHWERVKSISEEEIEENAHCGLLQLYFIVTK